MQESACLNIFLTGKIHPHLVAMNLWATHSLWRKEVAFNQGSLATMHDEDKKNEVYN